MSSKTNLEKRIRAGCVVERHGAVLMVLLKDPVSGHEFLAPPGGAVEKTETPLDAAIRETLEETGYQVQSRHGVCVTSDYFFVWAGKNYDCQTTHFLCDLSSEIQMPVHDASYVLGSYWIALNKITEVLGYNEQVRKSVLDCLALGGIRS